MTSPPTLKAAHTERAASNTTRTPPRCLRKHRTTRESRWAPDQNGNGPPTRPATRSASHLPSESAETTLGGYGDDGGMPENASSDTIAWHDVGVSERAQKMPSSLVPTLLQSVDDLSFPPRSSLGGTSGESWVVDRGTNASGNVPRYSTSQKAKWKAQEIGNVMHGNSRHRSPSPQLYFHNSVEEWAVHTRPILQDYADRQPSLPLGRRLEVSIDEPSRFILGAIQLLVNRDRKGCTDRSRLLGPQLLENFLDIDLWTTEYFRSRHGIQAVDKDVSTLLTIVINNFYEGQVQLIDRLVESALQNMRTCFRSSLDIQDFAFGFDFRMSQDLPFYVETCSQIRELPPVPVVEVQSTPNPVITSSGRQVKPTERAQAATKQAGNKGNNASRTKDKRATDGAVPAERPKKDSVSSDRLAEARETQTSSRTDRCVASPAPSKPTSEHPSHRPARPSNRGAAPPIPRGSLPTSGKTSSRPSGDRPNSKRDASTPSVTGPGDPGSSRSNLAVHSPASSRLKFRLRVPSKPTDYRQGSWRSPFRSEPASHGSWVQPREKTSSLRQEVSDRTTATPTVRPVAVDASDVAAKKATPAQPMDALENAAPGAADTSLDVRTHVAPVVERTGAALTPQDDPGHPHGKKRKLDHCED